MNPRTKNLSGADLSGADLSGEDLSGSDLSGSDLSGSNLRSADLSGSNLRGSNLRGADLRDAYLGDACLSGACLSGANLRDSNLRGADLSGANLSGSNLRYAYMAPIIADLHKVLAAAAEVPALLEALREGRDFARAVDLRPSGSDGSAERWLCAIRGGDTPRNNQVAAITAEWIEAWLEWMEKRHGGI
jgi:uncharacterized protein YjbI with pentapeptide repeats